MNKYRNKKIVVDGVTFDSKREAHRWRDLQLLEAAGEITGLQRQVKFELIPAQYVVVSDAEKKNKRKCIFRACTYKADFVYTDKNGKVHVEDSKGFITKDYLIKKKLMFFVKRILIEEV